MKKTLGVGVATGVLTAGAVGYVYERGIPELITNQFEGSSLPPDLLGNLVVGSNVHVSYDCEENAPCDSTHYLAKIGDQTQEPIHSLSEVSPGLVNAVVAEEDQRFWQHNGVDGRSLGRSALTDAQYFVGELVHDGLNRALDDWAVQGGSTIDEQVIKLAEPGKTEGLHGKLYEASEAIKLDDTLTQIEAGEGAKDPKEAAKAQILVTYLNSVYFGRGAWGVKAAAQVNFGVNNLTKLNVVQDATLAADIRDPSAVQNYNIPAERAQLIFNRNVAIKNFAEHYPQEFLAGVVGAYPQYFQGEGYASLDQAVHVAEAMPPNAYILPYQSPNLLTFSAAAVANEAQFPILESIHGAEAKLHISSTPQSSAEEQLALRGVKIYSTLNMRYQQAAYNATQTAHLLPDSAVALASLSPNGAVQAEIGGDYNKLQVNLASAQGGIGYPAGSSLKLFFTAEMLEHGGSLNDILTIPHSGKTTVRNPKTGAPYTVPNGECANPCTLVEAMAYSSDSYFAQVVANPQYANPGETPVESVIKMMQSAGMHVPNSNNLSVVLGATLTDPLAMAEGYNAILANDGVATPYYTIETIVGPNGQMLYQHRTPPATRVVPRIVAEETKLAAVGPVEWGTASQSITLTAGNPVGKTGTSTNSDDLWFNGEVSGEGTTSVWEGNPNRQAPQGNGSGGGDPARVWNDFEKQLVVFNPPGPEAITTPMPSIGILETTNNTVPPTPVPIVTPETTNEVVPLAPSITPTTTPVTSATISIPTPSTFQPPANP